MNDDLPDDMKQSLSETDYVNVLRWWKSLTTQQRQDYSDISDLAEDNNVTLAKIEHEDVDPEADSLYDYMVNHELRCVGYLHETEAANSYKIMSHYISSLGSEMTHRRSTVE